MLKSKLHSKRKKYTYIGRNAFLKEEESNLANLWNLPYTEEVVKDAESKPVNLFDRAFVNEKQSGNKNIININIFGCLSQNAISTGVA